MLYENMRNKVQNAVENGKVNGEYISNEERNVLNQYWRKDFTPRNHPSLIQVEVRSFLLNAIWILSWFQVCALSYFPYMLLHLTFLSRFEQVLLNAGKDVDATNQAMPNLIYVSREKNKAIQHNFKAGALNTLVS